MWTYGAIYHADLYDDDVLAHHGVKGMKWGVRRVQRSNSRINAQFSRPYGGFSPMVRVVKSKAGITRIGTGQTRRMSALEARVRAGHQRKIDKLVRDYTLDENIRAAKKKQRQETWKSLKATKNPVTAVRTGSKMSKDAWRKVDDEYDHQTEQLKRDYKSNKAKREVRKTRLTRAANDYRQRAKRRQQ